VKRGYQFGFSARRAAMHDVQGRERKARTMVAVLEDYLGDRLGDLRLLNVGGSAGIIDSYLSNHFGNVVGIDIDESAIAHAEKNYTKPNLLFLVGDALNLEFRNGSFDVVICSQVYEHVADAEKMMAEIFRVLQPGGVCYFAASNRIRWNEPHYNLPLLSVLPRSLADIYVKAAGKADHYYEKHYTFWGLQRLVKEFAVHDYTSKIAENPSKYFADYMIKPGSAKAAIAMFILKRLRWLSPGYIWLLEKPGNAPHTGVLQAARR
jgi:ubiquinone/menaquinone biosynthesis C-methylase UbiE